VVKKMMKMQIPKLTILMILICTTAILWCHAKPKAPYVFSEWVGYALEKLETDGITGGIHSSSRPFSRLEIAEMIAKAQARIASGTVKPKPIHVKFLTKLETEFSEELTVISGKPVPERLRLRAAPQLRSSPEHKLCVSSSSFCSRVIPAFEGAFGYELPKRFILYDELQISQNGFYEQVGETASKRLKPWQEDYVADFTRAYISFPISKFELVVGRDKVFWGPGYRGALGVSDNSPPFDLILLKGKYRNIKGTSFAAVLDKMWVERKDGYRYLASRYFAGHRFDWQVNDRLELGISETILYGGEMRNAEWQYMNPVLPIFASQYNMYVEDMGVDDNFMFTCDFAFIPVAGARIYGEMLIDDFHPYKNPEDPNAIGLLWGLHLSDFLKFVFREGIHPLKTETVDMRAEYARIGRWTYTHLAGENQYTHFGSAIGHWLNTDADALYVELNYPLNVDTLFLLSYEFQRQGEATVEDRYKGEKYEGTPYPTGIVEKKHTTGIRVLYEPIQGWQLDATYRHLILRNEDNISAKNAHKNEFELRLKYHKRLLKVWKILAIH